MDIADGQQLPDPSGIDDVALGRILLHMGQIGPELTADPVTAELRLAQLRRVRSLAMLAGQAAEHLRQEISSTDAAGTSVGAPTVEQAYADAPDLDAELATLSRMREDADPTQRPAHYPPLTPFEKRELLLRQAAVDDRILHLRHPADTTDAVFRLRALCSAELLIQHDFDHAGGAVEGSADRARTWPHQDQDFLGYVRQEYLTWLIRPDLPGLYV